MTRTKGMIGIAGGLLALAIALLAGTAFAGGATGGIAVSDGTAEPGASGDITVSATDVTAPGLGAWTIDVEYDPAVLEPAGCDAGSNVCNEAFEDNETAPDVVRLTGANAGGLEGTNVLATFTFSCTEDGAPGFTPGGTSTTGTSALTVVQPVSVFADATVGAPVDINPDPIVDGTFACAVAPTATNTSVPPTVQVAATSTVGGVPPTGSGTPTDSDGSLLWLVAGLAGVGLAGIVGFGALRMRSHRA